MNLYTGPDGLLYLVDMYHGILQHRIYLTSYLRKQIESQGLLFKIRVIGSKVRQPAKTNDANTQKL